MAYDLGQAIGNIGTGWANALVGQRERETRDKQLALENVLKQDQFSLQQQQFAQQAESQAYDQQLGMAERFAGQQMPTGQAEAIFNHPALRQLVLQKMQKPTQLGSTQFSGMALAPGMQSGSAAGASAYTPDHSAPLTHTEVAPGAMQDTGMSEVQLPVTNNMRVAQLNQEGATERARELAGVRQTIFDAAAKQKEELGGLQRDMTERIANARNDTMMAVAGMRGAGNGKRTTKIIEDVDETGKAVRHLIDSETGDIIKTYDKPQTQVKNNMAGAIGELEAVNTLIDEAEKLGTASKWAGTGPVESRVARVAGAIPGVGGSLTDPNEEKLRQLISNIGARVRHELYGAALTGGEREQANRFIAQYEANPVQLATSLAGLKAHNNAVLGRIRPAGGVGNPGGAPANSGTSSGARVRVVTDANGNLVDAATGKPIQ